MKAVPPRALSVGPPPLAAFAVDLDRTLLRPGRSLPRSASTILGSVRKMGLKVVLVSGREYDRLTAFARELNAVDALVAENGAVLEVPLGGGVRTVGRRSGAQVRQRLLAGRITGVEAGDVVVSVPRAMGSYVARLLADLPVDLIPNADRMMVVPEGVSKGSGMQRVLRALRLGSREYAAIGDGENDIGLLRAAALSGAVANAPPSVRSVVDYVCRARFEAGVAEFVTGPLADRVSAKPPSRPSLSQKPRRPSNGIVPSLQRRS
jgi:hydroxymethylpyrimidine pyrophosphatase-like HAD family hydrolase